MTLSPESETLSPLPNVLSQGLIAITTFGILSFICSLSLFIFLSYRLLTWRRQSTNSQTKDPTQSRTPPHRRPTNQFLFLIYNLLLADIQQSLAFSFNLASLTRDAISVGTSECWAQGWFVSTGDLASSVFILAIAVHTYMSVVRQYRLPSLPFYCGIAGCWIFVYALGIIGPAMYRQDFYVRAGAWCWINDAYQSERLWLHYIWIFLSIFITILIYVLIFIHLNRLLPRNSTLPLSSDPEPININPNQNLQYYPQQQQQQTTTTEPDLSATPMMLLYPLIYTLCTTPLAAGRAASMAGREVSLAYFCIAGSMLACNGWLDVLLYATTRSDIVFAEYAPSEETGLETFAFMGKGHKLGTVTTVQGGNGELGVGGGGRHGRNGSVFGRVMASRDRERRDREREGRESRENLYAAFGGQGVGGSFVLGQIEVKESVNVTIERSDRTGRMGSWSGGSGEGGSVKSLYP